MRMKLAEFKQRLEGVTDTDWARLAAFIDGEGTISVNFCKSSVTNGSPRHYVQVMITSTSVALMDWLTNTFLGTVYAVKANGLGKKPVWRWQLNERQADFILSRCAKFLIIKVGQANCALQLCALKAQGIRRKRVAPEMLAARDALRQQIKAYNNLVETDRPIKLM